MSSSPPSQPPGDPRSRRWQAPRIGPARPLKRLLPSVRSMAHGYAGHTVEALVFLLLTPFIVRSLGLGAFGLWSLAVALAEWLQLLDLGLKEAVMKYTAAHQARSDAHAVRRVSDTALFIYTMAGVVAFLIGLGLAWFALPYMVDDTAALGEERVVLMLLVLSAALSLPGGLTGTLLEGLSRFDLINLFRIGLAGLRLVLVVLALQLELGLVGVAAAELGARVALHAGRWWAVYRIDPVLVPRPWPHRDQRARLLGFGAWNALRQAGEVAVTKLYEPILSLLAGLPAVGAFYLGRRLGSMPAELIVPMAGVLFPLSSELEAAGRGRTLQQTFLTATKFSLVVAIPLSLVLSLGAGPILANWMGGRTPEAAPVLSVFALVFMVVAAALPSEVMLLGLGHARALAILGIVQGALTIGVGVPAVRVLGPTGLALAGLGAVLVTQALIQIPLASSRCNLEFSQLLRRGLLPPILAALPVGFLMWLLAERVAVGGLAALAAWAGGGVATYGMLLWWFGFEAEEKAFLRSQFKRLILDPSEITDWEEVP